MSIMCARTKVITKLGSQCYHTICWSTPVGMVAENNNMGKKKCIQEDDLCMLSIHKYFDELVKLGLACATKKMHIIVNNVTRFVIDKDNGNVAYLNSIVGPRLLYYQYTKNPGYIIKPTKKGINIRPVNPSILAHKENHLSPICVYHWIWKQGYVYLKMSMPLEDICIICVIFRNQYKLLEIYHTCPVADDVLHEIGAKDIFDLLNNTVPNLDEDGGSLDEDKVNSRSRTDISRAGGSSNDPEVKHHPQVCPAKHSHTLLEALEEKVKKLSKDVVPTTPCQQQNPPEEDVLHKELQPLAKEKQEADDNPTASTLAVPPHR